MEEGYSIDDPRRRALWEDLTAHFGERGPTYRVDNGSENTYRVDAEAETSTCLNYAKRVVCWEHQRRVDLKIHAGEFTGTTSKIGVGLEAETRFRG